MNPASKDALAALTLFFLLALAVYVTLAGESRRERERAKRQQPVVDDAGPVIVSREVEWLYEVPPRRDAQVWLLTIGDVAVRGNWHGDLGDFYKAWHPVPKRNKQRERELGLLTSEKA